MQEFDVVVIGGGFYGCSIALQLKKYFSKVLVIEKEDDLMLRASLVNQARVHNGYHYPRNLVTAYRSFINFPLFTKEYKNCIVDDFTMLYAIARTGSKVNAHQFHEMYKGIRAPIEVAHQKYQNLFKRDLIDEVFLVKEYAFDAAILRNIMRHRLEDAGVNIWYRTEVISVEQCQNDSLLNITLKAEDQISSKLVFNCTYSQINKLIRDSKLSLLPMKHELTEMALIQMPEELQQIGFTVMDGPFFSTMPYPTKQLHSLSHVRYTPHFSWLDQENFMDGHRYLNKTDIKSNYLYMLKDAQRYIPTLSEAKYVDSIFEIKTVLLQNEEDDGRPILYRENYGFKNFFNIMGGKIDNIYDILERINENTHLGNRNAIAGAKR
ncbi:amino acid oxidase [Bacillus sp. T33-2]|nr:amino acid oxidase [Bacillus sp. T33-2]